MTLKLTEHQEVLLEKYGLLMERFGLSPVATRINALLTIVDKEAISFDEISSTLQISKSATSTALNVLISLGYVNFKTVLGDRKRYFYAETESWKIRMGKSFEVLLELAEVLNEIANCKSDKDLTQKKDVIACSNFLTELGNCSIRSLQDTNVE